MNRISMLFLLSVPALCACDVTEVTVYTDAPPGRVAQVVDEHVTLSSAVAVAMECTYSDYETYYSAPCPDFTVSVGDEDIVEVSPALLDLPSYAQDGVDRAVVVLVGKTPGTTTIAFTHEFATVEYGLTVVAAPGVEDPE